MLDVLQAQRLLAIRDAFIVTLQAAHEQLQQEKEVEVHALRAAHQQAQEATATKIEELLRERKQTMAKLQKAEVSVLQEAAAGTKSACAAVSTVPFPAAADVMTHAAVHAGCQDAS
jgi:hypothetical protein